MKRLAALVLLVLCAGGPAAAQPRDPGSAADVSSAAERRDADEALLANARGSKPAREEPPPAPVAQAISLAFGTTFFNEVHISTSGAVVDLSRLSREGFYKLELIQLLLLSSRSRVPLAELAKRRRKGEALRELSFKNGVDYDKLYDASLAVQEIVDRDYLPRFPQRRPRKEKEE
jgi:hypothetical protein